MKLGRKTKQPAERLDYDVVYGDWLANTDDTIASAQVTATPPGIDIDVVQVSDHRVKVWLSGGTDGETYKIEVTAETAAGAIKQDEFDIRVKEY
ncbi:MAG: hypothetical protein WC997_02435 [Porticoccaceae bacterium]